VRAQAQAEADAIKPRDDAEAQAIAARGKALGENPSLVSLVQAEKWNGKLPATMVPGGAIPMIGCRSEMRRPWRGGTAAAPFGVDTGAEPRADPPECFTSKGQESEHRSASLCGTSDPQRPVVSSAKA